MAGLDEFLISGDDPDATVDPGDGEGNAAFCTIGIGVADAAEAAAAPRFGVTIVGKTDPFKMPPANMTNNNEAKIAPYRGDSKIPLQPFVSAAKLNKASPSAGAAWIRCSMLTQPPTIPARVTLRMVTRTDEY